MLEKKLKHWWRNNLKYRTIAFVDYGMKKQCSKCNTCIDICIHHIDNNFLNNSKENLLPICRSCHFSLHNKWKKNTDVHRKKISDNNGNKWKFWSKNHSSKKVIQYIGFKKVIYWWIKEAERITWINNSNIVRACKTWIKAWGYNWEYFLKI